MRGCMDRFSLSGLEAALPELLDVVEAKARHARCRYAINQIDECTTLLGRRTARRDGQGIDFIKLNVVHLLRGCNNRMVAFENTRRISFLIIPVIRAGRLP